MTMIMIKKFWRSRSRSNCVGVGRVATTRWRTEMEQREDGSSSG